MRRLAPALALALCAALPATAQAGTLRLFEGQETSHSTDKFSVAYIAAAGERNDVTAVWDEASLTYTISDPGAAQITHPLQLGPALATQVLQDQGVLAPRPGTCTVKGRSAVCRPSNPYDKAEFLLHLGDGDDVGRLDLGDDDAVVYGHDGDDVLTATSLPGGIAEINGHGGDDVLTGGGGRDFLHGGHGADRVDGGAGRDRVTYVNHFTDPERGEVDSSQNANAGVSITHDGVANDGQPGEGDDVAAGEDELRGTSFGDVIVGGAGTQIVDAGAGDDDVDGGPGEDFVEGSAGDDVLRTHDGEADDYACGAGTDAVLADPLDAFGVLPLPWGPGTPRPDDCEAVTVTP